MAVVPAMELQQGASDATARVANAARKGRFFINQPSGERRVRFGAPAVESIEHRSLMHNDADEHGHLFPPGLPAP